MLTRAEYREQIPAEVIFWRYWYCSQGAVYIVAVKTEYGQPNAWCAYIGSNQEGAEIEEAGVAYVRKHGDELVEAEARAFFPQFTDRPYIQE